MAKFYTYLGEDIPLQNNITPTLYNFNQSLPLRTGTDICPLSFWREVGEEGEVNLLAKQVKRMKKCTSCGEEKEFAEFYKSQSELYKADGKLPICKD